MSISVKSINQTSPLFFWLTNMLAFTCLLLLMGLFAAEPAYAIKKCKDANGKWHYGDVAVRACEDSKITTLSDSGFIKEEKAAPKTKEQLAAEESERLENAIEEQRKQDLEREKTRVLSVYETEADIDRQRDNQLYSVDSNIAVHNTYLESLQEQIKHEQKKVASTKNTAIKARSEKKIVDAEASYKTYSTEVVALQARREDIIKRFDQEKLLYRELIKPKETTE